MLHRIADYLSFTSMTSASMIPLWDSYYMVSQTEIEGWLREPYREGRWLVAQFTRLFNEARHPGWPVNPSLQMPLSIQQYASHAALVGLEPGFSYPHQTDHQRPVN